MPFFHDREVGAEVRVEDAVEAEALQGGDHLSRDDGAGRQMEFVAQGDAHGGRDLHDDVLLRILQGVEDALRIVFFRDRSRRTDEAALAAEDAVGRFQGAVVGGRDGDLVASAFEVQGLDALYVFAGADAAAAFDTF